jgi:hypothetical protein
LCKLLTGVGSLDGCLAALVISNKVHVGGVAPVRSMPFDTSDYLLLKERFFLLQKHLRSLNATSSLKAVTIILKYTPGPQASLC